MMLHVQALCHEETFMALIRMALHRPSVQILGLLYRLASQGPPEVQIMLEPHVEDFVALAKVMASASAKPNQSHQFQSRSGLHILL